MVPQNVDLEIKTKKLRKTRLPFHPDHGETQGSIGHLPQVHFELVAGRSQENFRWQGLRGGR